MKRPVCVDRKFYDGGSRYFIGRLYSAKCCGTVRGASFCPSETVSVGIKE
jgi:hypothetical protein